MKRSPVENVLAFASGAIFAVGLALSGMTRPGKVVAFLDVAGDWDPSLMFVMGGAIMVYAVASRLVLKRKTPLVGSGFNLPTRKDIEPNLVIGAAIFGVGWGLAGYCPGPALTSLGSGAFDAILFVAMMTLGMRLYDTFQRMRTGRPREAIGGAATGR